jgi:hypothetical protein
MLSGGRLAHTAGKGSERSPAKLDYSRRVPAAVEPPLNWPIKKSGGAAETSR